MPAAAGVHRPQGFMEKDESLILLRKWPNNGEEPAAVPSIKFNTKDIFRASEMESFVVWDSTRGSRLLFELAAFPCLAGASKDNRFESVIEKPRYLRGKWETLARCGEVFENCESIKFIICDGHGSHLWLRELLLGQTISLQKDLLSELPFWKQLQQEDLPMTCIPFPWRIVRVKGESIHYIPGTGMQFRFM